MLSHCESHTVDHGLLTPVPVEDLQETSLKLLDNFAMDSNRSIASPFGQVPCDTEIKNNAECDVCHKVHRRPTLDILDVLEFVHLSGFSSFWFILSLCRFTIWFWHGNYGFLCATAVDN